MRWIRSGGIPGILVLGLFALVHGCALGNAYRFTAVDIKVAASGSGSVAVTVVDRRSFVVSRQKEPSFVGLMRAQDGTAFNVRTGSGRPLADDMSETVARALRYQGYDTQTVLADIDEASASVRQRLVETGAVLCVQIDIYEWLSDARVDVTVDYDFVVYIINASGQVIARHRVSAKEVLKGEPLDPTGFAIHAVPYAFGKALESLLNERNVQRALEQSARGSGVSSADKADAGPDASPLADGVASDAGVGTPAAPPTVKPPTSKAGRTASGMNTMRELKAARRAGRISQEEYAGRKRELRRLRAGELWELQELFRSGAIKRGEYDQRALRIRRKYEGE